MQQSPRKPTKDVVSHLASSAKVSGLWSRFSCSSRIILRRTSRKCQPGDLKSKWFQPANLMAFVQLMRWCTYGGFGVSHYQRVQSMFVHILPSIGLEVNNGSLELCQRPKCKGLHLQSEVGFWGKYGLQDEPPTEIWIDLNIIYVFYILHMCIYIYLYI